MQNLKYIDEHYLNYLRKIEPRIPNSNYGAFKMKPFFGELFRIGNLVYVTQISSPKPRHNNLKEQMDFRKVYKNGKLICVINLNYMFPVPENCLSDIKYKDIEKYRQFTNNVEKSKYIQLLKYQLNIISNSMNIEFWAKQVYKNKHEFPESVMAKRSFDFKLLETHALKFGKKLLNV